VGELSPNKGFAWALNMGPVLSKPPSWTLIKCRVKPETTAFTKIRDPRGREPRVFPDFFMKLGPLQALRGVNHSAKNCNILAERHEGNRVFQRRKSKMLPDFSCEMRRVTSAHENWAFLKAYFRI
jgi:hypothetical protein